MTSFRAGVQPSAGRRHNVVDGVTHEAGLLVALDLEGEAGHDLYQPPPFSSIETTSALARTLVSTGTGAGKRILFQP